jgi:hypothetical protein
VITARDGVDAWPFLVARGRREGYRTLLAPEFLVRRDLHEQLAESSPSVRSGTLGRAELNGAAVGSLRLVYTTEDLTAAMSDGSDEVKPLTDEHGRPLEMLYGVVAREPLSDALAAGDLQPARAEALDTYRIFLTREKGFPVMSSRPYPLPRGATAVPTRAPAPEGVPRVNRPRATPRPRVLAITLGVLVLAIAAAAIGRALTGNPPPTVHIVSVRSSPADGFGCQGASALRFQAVVTTSRSTRLRYRWVSVGDPAAPDAGGTVRLAGTRVTLEDRIEGASGPYELVIDQPVQQQMGPVACG